MGKPKAPKAPDPVKTASAQTGSNLTSAMSNNLMGMVNQYGPNGSLTYNQTGSKQITDPTTGHTYDIPQYSATTSLNPTQQWTANTNDQATADLAYSLQKRTGEYGASDRKPISAASLPGIKATPDAYNAQNLPALAALPNGIDTNNLPSVRGVPQASDATRRRVEDALMQRMNPQISRDREQMRTDLINQGINTGSDAYSSTVGDFDRGVNDARLGAILSAGQEQSRVFGDEMQGFNASLANRQNSFGERTAQFGANMDRYGASLQGRDAAMGERAQIFNDQLRAQEASRGVRGDALNEALTLRQQPLQEILALRGASQGQQPNFQMFQPQGAATTDYAGMVGQQYNARNQAYMQNAQNRSGLFGNLIGAGGMIGASMFSDRRLKRDIAMIGKIGPLPVYSFTYVWGQPTIGFMADEVARVVPDAVTMHESGFAMVDYGRALGAI